MTHKPKPATAVEKLRQSTLDPKQVLGLDGMGDVNLESLMLRLKNAVPIQSIDLVEDVVVERTIEGASTVTVTVIDDKGELRDSGRLTQEVYVQIDGLYFELANVKKNGTSIDLVFEDREVAILRRHNKRLGPIARKQITRAQFVKRLAEEPKELKIRTYIPELLDPQPIEATKSLLQLSTPNQTQGVPVKSGGQSAQDAHNHGETNVGLMVKTEAASPTQIKNANIILSVGVSMKARRKVLVASIMCVIQESSIKNLRKEESKDKKHVGIFQQDPRFWPASRDIAKDAGAFFSKAIGYDKANPRIAYQDLVEGVQHSGLPQLYAQWRIQAERFVTAYGIPGGDSETRNQSSQQGGSIDNAYYFYRGVPPTKKTGLWKKEDSWTAIQRLAADVQWRAFMISGTLWYADEEYLFRSMPAMTLTESDPAVISTDFDYDNNKAYGVITAEVFIKRWLSPPGTVALVDALGPVDGRWLVTQMRRSMFSEQATITLKKPLPALPEPSGSNLSAVIANIAPVSSTTQKGQRYKVATALVNPIPQGKGGTHGVEHGTKGLDGYQAYDFFANAGTPVLAVESGEIVRFSGHPPSLGPTEGLGGPLGWSIYLLGDSGTEYYLTHLGTRTTFVKAKVQAGQQIATVADYKSWGGTDHVHVGVHPGPSGRPNLADLGSAPQAVG